MKTAQQLFDDAFDVPREPRSAEYKAGVLYILERRCGEIEKSLCPYPMGSAQSDAWYSGTDEGHRIFNAHREAKHA